MYNIFFTYKILLNIHNSMMNEIYSANIHNPDCRAAYIEEAPDVPPARPGFDVPRVHLDFQSMNPVGEVEVAGVAAAVEEQEEVGEGRRRSYHRVSQDDRNTLKRLFANHEGDPGYTFESYHMDSGIPRNNLKRLLAALRKGQSIDLKHVKKGRPTKFSRADSQVISEALQNRSTLTLTEIRTVVLNERRQRRAAEEGSDTETETESEGEHEPRH